MKSKYYTVVISVVTLLCMFGCRQNPSKQEAIAGYTDSLVPVVITEPTENDTDDPAIWYNRQNPEQSLILGTDKGDTTGGIYVFNLDGKIDHNRTIRNLKRPNNIDIRYSFPYKGKYIDIAVFTERGRDMIRVISLPDCRFIDNGGIEVFAGDSLRSPMGIALYTNPKGEFYAFVGRKTGPKQGYIHQIQLVENAYGIGGRKIREFGAFSGIKEIEAMVADDETGYLFYCDEGVGIRKYHAEPGKGDHELALFGTGEFAEDHEGISIVPLGKKAGYIIVSDQQANLFRIYKRFGQKGQPHTHMPVRTVKLATLESDGSEALPKNLGKKFPKGIFVAMSTDKTFHFYRLDEVLGK